MDGYSILREMLGTDPLESKQLDCRGEAGYGGEAGITRQQSSAEAFGESDVGRSIRGQIVTELPNPGQQKEVGIASDSQVEQVFDCLIRALCRDSAFPHQASQHLADFE